MRLPSQISDHPESSKSSHPLIYSDSTDSLSQSSRLKYGFTSSKRRITQPGMRPNKVPSKKTTTPHPHPPHTTITTVIMIDMCHVFIFVTLPSLLACLFTGSQLSQSGGATRSPFSVSSASILSLFTLCFSFYSHCN